MTPTRIVADVDAHSESHPALDWAVRIAEATGAALTVVDVVDPAAGQSPTLEDDLIELVRGRLDQIVAGIHTVDRRTRVLVGTAGAALIAAVESEAADLVVRSRARDLSQGTGPYGPVDRILIRECPVPVLLAGAGGMPSQARVLGAVAPEQGRPQVAALNRRIIDHTLLMSAVTQGTPTVLQAWTPFAEWRLRSHGAGDALACYLDQHRSGTVAAVAEAVHAAGVSSESVQIAVPHGVVGEALPAYVVRHGVDLLVVGVPRRRGLSRLIRGHTADRVLSRLLCSVLAVPPD